MCSPVCNPVPSKTGENVYLIGLAIQLFFFASFAFVTVYVYYLQQTRAVNKVPPQVFTCLAATIALVTPRNIYRVIEIAVSLFLLAMLLYAFRIFGWSLKWFESCRSTCTPAALLLLILAVTAAKVATLQWQLYFGDMHKTSHNLLPVLSIPTMLHSGWLDWQIQHSRSVL